MIQELSILIPTFNGDCRQQVAELSRQAEGIGGLRYEIVIADDGSDDPNLVELNRQVEHLPFCRFIDRKTNCGRAVIRNFLAHEARYEWLLFMDCDMTIVSPDFISNYLHGNNTDIAYGGYIVGEGDESCLRYIYERQCEHTHKAEERRKRPFMHFHTCNFLVRREVMLNHPFDERFRNYGYEDVFFGKQLRKAGISISHLDNPAGFCHFESNMSFVDKTEEGLRTLHQFRNDLRGYSNLLTFTEGIHLPPVRAVLRLWHRLFGTMERRNLCGNSPNLSIFKLYKLGYYLNL